MKATHKRKTSCLGYMHQTPCFTPGSKRSDLFYKIYLAVGVEVHGFRSLGDAASFLLEMRLSDRTILPLWHF